MLEIILLCAIILLLPQSGDAGIWIALLALLVIPGMYATWTGAPFVPTPKRILRTMMALANVRKGDRVFDLGCGDGRLVFAAAKQGAVATGYEYSIPTFLLAKIRSLFIRGSRIHLRDFWKQDYTKADVIFCYLLTDSMQTFQRIVWPQLRPGCRVVSHAFLMRDIEPTQRENSVALYVKLPTLTGGASSVTLSSLI